MYNEKSQSKTNMSFDFIHYSLNINQGQQESSLAGGLVSAAPRLANRLRRDDLIALLLTIRGSKDNEDAEIKKITQQLSQVFFQTMGSVTRAMSAVGQEINRILLDYNLDAAHEGEQLEGCLNLAVLHKGTLFICHAGPTSTYVLHPDKVDIFKEEVNIKPMGANRNIQVQYYQAEIQPSNIFLFSSNPPSSWTHSNLSGSSYLSIEQVRRRLLNQAGENLQALVVKILPGRGRVEAGEWAPEVIKESIPPEPQMEDQPPLLSDLQIKPQVLSEKASDVIVNSTGLLEGDLPGPTQELQVPVIDERKSDEIIKSADASEEGIPIQTGETEQVSFDQIKSSPAGAEKSVAQKSNFMQKMADLWLKSEESLKKCSLFFSKLIKKALPYSTGKIRIPPAALVFLLIFIPLLLVAASLTVYSRSGRDEQFRSYLDLAQQYHTLATIETDPIRQYEYWRNAYETVARAEQYGSNVQSATLLELAQTSMDSMDLTSRLDFRPALTQSLPQEVNIVDISVSGTDVYVLDGKSGAILRLAYNSKGYYEVDSSFICAPGPSGLNTIGKLIDLVALPPNQPFNYKVMGLDADGNLLYCIVGDNPSSQKLPAPSGGWKRITSFTLDDAYLYVLDADSDSVWIYEGTDINFTSTPYSFFDEFVPDLGGAIDLVVNKEDMYILNADGHMTTCQYGASKEVKLTTCQDPKPYTDNRLGREKNPWLFMDASFISMQATSMPNASLYVLDAANRAVLQFSYQLNLEKTLKVKPNRTYPIPNTNPTAFGVNNSQSLFLAFGNQIYFASLVQ